MNANDIKACNYADTITAVYDGVEYTFEIECNTNVLLRVSDVSLGCMTWLRKTTNSLFILIQSMKQSTLVLMLQNRLISLQKTYHLQFTIP